MSAMNSFAGQTGCRYAPMYKGEVEMDFVMTGTLIVCFLLVVALAAWCDAQGNKE